MVNDFHNTDNTGPAPSSPEEPPALPTPEWGTMADAADILGMSRMTVTRYARDGRIRTRRKGPRLIEVDLTSLEDVYGPIDPVEAARK